MYVPVGAGAPPLNTTTDRSIFRQFKYLSVVSAGQDYQSSKTYCLCTCVIFFDKPTLAMQTLSSLINIVRALYDAITVNLYVLLSMLDNYARNNLCWYIAILYTARKWNVRREWLNCGRDT